MTYFFTVITHSFGPLGAALCCSRPLCVRALDLLYLKGWHQLLWAVACHCAVNLVLSFNPLRLTTWCMICWPITKLLFYRHLNLWFLISTSLQLLPSVWGTFRLKWHSVSCLLNPCKHEFLLLDFDLLHFPKFSWLAFIHTGESVVANTGSSHDMGIIIQACLSLSVFGPLKVV